MIYFFIGQISSKLYKEYSMLKENIILKQWSPQITLRASTQKQQHFSYSRHLSTQFDNSVAETKPINGHSQGENMILRPSWVNIFKGQNNNRKDEMLKILKGKNYNLVLIKKKSYLDLIQSQKQKTKKDIINTTQNKSLQKAKKNSLSQKYEQQNRNWTESSRKYLNKTLRLQKMLNQLIINHL